MTDDELSEAARSLHREWQSPDLWPTIATEIAALDRTERHDGMRRRRWQRLAAAAVIVLAVAASVLLVRERSAPDDRVTPPVVRAGERLLSDEALSEVERAEAQYVAAIEALAKKTIDSAEAPASPVLANLRERLLAIDSAIADCRAEIDRNRFNAHLRRQLLSIYQEKRRTLEQILEQEQHVS
jgi:hypothetical protein